ncbi:uncharacterized protein LOC104893789 [Beta vulgaris subsp. vulgaris]|uniref:uncharacterized protein LOC104893789 n=1 Tax=Beta vulgaris subsp. vulgaris TaxID=3555 RepID=UPI0005401C12|nr:uncharacterized protein LOC104893789 [Beta vulgaris subsp. vulgaris]
MADDLAAKSSKLNIEEDENTVIDLGSDDNRILDAKTSLMLVGKIVSERTVNLEALRRTMNQIWALNRSMIVRSIGVNLFVFQFFHWKDKEKILAGRPWCFDEKLLLLEEVRGNEQPSQVVIVSSPFWVWIYNLPFNYRSKTEVSAIAGSLGLVLNIDLDDLGLEKFCRVKVLLNVYKPLRRKQKIRRKDGKVSSIEYKYERLPNFCFRCGVMGHSDKDCHDATYDEDDQELGWGTWLKASPLKGRLRNKEEVVAITTRRKALFVIKEARGDDGLQ